MIRQWPKFGLLAASLLVLTLIVSTATAADKNAKFYKGRFDHFSKVIADLKDADVTEVAGQDIELIRTWISQAQAYLASEKLGEIDPLLLRMAAQSEYIRAKVQRVAAEEAADEAEQAAGDAEKAAAESKQAAETASTKMKELEAKGL